MSEIGSAIHEAKKSFKLDSADVEAIATLRRDIHAHPELCFEEQRTSDLIAKTLSEWGIPVHRGLGTTGVVGIIKNGSSHRALGLRADIDALPMTEHNRFAHASVNAGKMHACGHDGHTAMLLAAARQLSRQRNFDGTVYVVFQPAEEGGGGAREMIKDGLFKLFPMQAIFGVHNWPGIAAGQYQDPRQGRARRDAAQRYRPGARGMPNGAGIPDHHHPQ
jgi:amidohydrolase